MADPSTRTAERTLSLLSAVCDMGVLTLGEAAATAELSPSTALRLLRTLEMSGFVSRDQAGLFTPGVRVLQFGALAVSKNSLISLCMAPMLTLVEQTAESAYLCIRGPGQTGVYIAIEEGSHSVRHVGWVGSSIPLEGTAAGAALTNRVPALGYTVVSKGVEADVTAIAAPIKVADRTVGALSILVPSYRLGKTDITRIGQLLVNQTSSVFNALSDTQLDLERTS